MALTLNHLPAPLRVLRFREYALYTLGNGISLTGSWMQRLAMGWLMWKLTGSGTWLGVLAAADLLPVLLIGPLAGALADRWNRLNMTRIAQMLSAGLAAGMAVLAFFDLLSVASLIAFAVISGSIVAMNQPARLALVQALVPRTEIGAAVALSSVNVNLARITGPAIAGWMIVHLPVGCVFLANAAVTALFVAILLRLRPHPTPARKPGGRILSDIAEGFSYTVTRRDIRLLLTFLCLGGMALRAMLDLAPALAARSFETGVVGLAFLTSAMAAGAVAAGLLSGMRTEPGGLIRRTLLSWAAGAVAVIVLSVGAPPAIAIAAMASIGFCVTRGVVGTQTYVQLTVPDDMRGRALSLHGLIARASPALGALAIGAASDIAGLTLPLCIGGAVLLAAAGLALLRPPRG